MKKAILIVLDSLGIGPMPDCARYGDDNPHTLQSLYQSQPKITYPNLEKMGLKRLIDSSDQTKYIKGAYFGKLAEKSVGKDTTTGHWEMCGIITTEALAVYPNGFPKEMLKPFLAYLGSGILGNEAASGTEIIERFGAEHLQSAKPIIYTSADSVLQIAAHEDVIPLERLYEMCAKARELYKNPPYQVGRIIARPFYGEIGKFVRDNANRRDYALDPPQPHLLTCLAEQGKEVVAVGKIEDIFAKSGITKAIHTVSNNDGMAKTIAAYRNLTNGLIFTNLVEFDSKYGHRRDPLGYAQALAGFDEQLPQLTEILDDETLLIICADHGCDPLAPGSDHTREYVPWLIYSPAFNEGGMIPKGESFADIGATIAQYLEIAYSLPGKSCLSMLR